MVFAAHQIILVIKLRRMRWVVHVAGMVEKGNTYGFWRRKEGKRQFGRPRYRQEEEKE